MFLAESLAMASIWKHPESQYWYACFTRLDGTRTKKSTKTTDGKLAQKLADEFEQAARKKRTSLAARRTIQELHTHITGEEIGFPSAAAFFEEWLTEKEGEVAPSTLVFYRGVAKKFLTWLGKRAEEDLANIEHKHLIAFRNEEFKTLTAKTVNHEVKALRMIFRAARQKKLLSENPAEFLKTVKGESNTKRRPFALAEIQAILAVCDAEWRSMVIFGLYTGQRLIDIALLRTSNVDLTAGMVRLKDRKTGKSMQIPIAPALDGHIQNLKLAPSDDRPLHPRAFQIVLEQGKTGHLSNQFADVLARAGLRKKKTHRKSGEERGSQREPSGPSFHSLRHTAVTLLKEAGIPAAVVMEMIGHDSEAMSQHYTHVGIDAMKKAAETMPKSLF